MKTIEAIKNRYSCRNYKGKEIPEDKLKKVLKAAQLAPSAHNSQPWKIVVVKKQNLKDRVAQTASQPFIAQASVILACVSTNPDEMMSCQVPSYPVDCAIAMDHLSLRATEEGLATCWIGAFDQKKAKKLLDVPEDNKMVILMPLGYPADSKGKKQRKALDKLICYNQYK